jgi:hypothetical protein
MENNNSSRRTVKNTSILTGGAIALPLISKANFFSGGDDAIKVALITVVVVVPVPPCKPAHQTKCTAGSNG